MLLSIPVTESLTELEKSYIFMLIVFQNMLYFRQYTCLKEWRDDEYKQKKEKEQKKQSCNICS